jgi:hypothetical protein
MHHLLRCALLSVNTAPFTGYQHVMQLSGALQEHYGKPDSDSVQRIKAVYNDLGLEQRFFDYEQVGRLFIRLLLLTLAALSFRSE